MTTTIEGGDDRRDVMRHNGKLTDGILPYRKKYIR